MDSFETEKTLKSFNFAVVKFSGIGGKRIFKSQYLTSTNLKINGLIGLKTYNTQ